MPKGALFHLHCLTRGEEEQVFHIENGVQVFVSNQAEPGDIIISYGYL